MRIIKYFRIKPFILTCSFISIYLIVPYVWYSWLSVSPNEGQITQNEKPLISSSKVENVPIHTKETCYKLCKSRETMKLKDKEDEKKRYAQQIGNIMVDKEKLAKLSLLHVLERNRPYFHGGSWSPWTENGSKCSDIVPSGLAVIIPLRYRWYQIPALLSQLIPLLRKQRVCYRIFVVEQTSVGPWNKGILLNVGFIEALKLFEFQCVVLHDVDLIPTNDLNPYTCDADTLKQAIHLGVAIDVWNYMMYRRSLIGGVLKMSRVHYEQVNGFSNLFWEWGGEDDDMEKRLRSKNISYRHIRTSVARYVAMPHVLEPRRWLRNNQILQRVGANRLSTDGLNSVRYRLLMTKETELFTHFLVDFNKPTSI